MSIESRTPRVESPETTARQLDEARAERDVLEEALAATHTKQSDTELTAAEQLTGAMKRMRLVAQIAQLDDTIEALQKSIRVNA